jgi:hypothetical protein
MTTTAGFAAGASCVFAALLGACGTDPSTRPEGTPQAGTSGNVGSGGTASAGNAGIGASGAGTTSGGVSGTAAGGVAGASGAGGSLGGSSGAGSGLGAAGASAAGASAAGAGGGGLGGAGSGGSVGDPGTGGGLAGAGAGSAGTSGSAGAAGSGGGNAESLSFAADIWPIFAEVRDPPFVYLTGDVYEGCTTIGVCHGGQNPGANLHMPDAETAYDELLNVPSVTGLCDDTIRVVPGNPSDSCLILFYEGRLRDELAWVEEAEIELVRRWISGGALP